MIYLPRGDLAGHGFLDIITTPGHIPANVSSMADVRATRTTLKQLKSARAPVWVRNQYASFKGKPEDQFILFSNSLTDKPHPEPLLQLYYYVN